MVREGYIERIVYKSEETGYVVMAVETTDNDEEIFVGNLAQAAEGLYISAEGEYVKHPQYDLQFKFTSCEISVPDDIYGIERYLGSGVIKGIGEVLAKRIVNKFKMDTMRILDEEPERLAEVKGISMDKARKIAVSYSETREVQKVLIFLAGYGINVRLAMKIYNEYGNDVYNVVKGNPYRIAEDIAGVGFKTADEIADKVGIEKNSVYRKRSALLYTLSQAMGLGHMFIPERMLIAKVKELLGINYVEAYEDDFSADEFYEEFHDILLTLSMERKVVLKRLVASEFAKGKFKSADVTDEDSVIVVYMGVNYYVEVNSASLLSKLRVEYGVPEDDIEMSIRGIESDLEIELEESQRDAVKSAIKNGCAVITGGPGTGKTTIINTIIEYFAINGMDVKLAAPTGRAAKRITESSGHIAETIHRLLEFSGAIAEDGKSAPEFGRNEGNPLECDAVIIDEASMIDSYLFYALLKAIAPGTRLILVGDTDQLPSVGAGNVLHDIIDSGIFPVNMLTKIFRQAEDSAIIKNAHLIKNGQPIQINNLSSDFFFIAKDSARSITEEVKVLVRDNLPKYLKIDKNEIQVLTPMRKADLGVENLNRELQKALNPAARSKREKEKNEVIFREGDKVMQIKNNYKLEWTIYSRPDGGYEKDKGVGVFNGDMGIIKKISDFDEEVTVLFDDGRTAIYSFNQLDELEHAFAVTIHKSQGSEYPAIIIPILNGPRKLLNRNLLYTAVTRAKSMVVVVGNVYMLNQMINNIDEQMRYTTFAERLRETVELE